MDNKKECQGVITTCEHVIADQGKVLLSSEQYQYWKQISLSMNLCIKDKKSMVWTSTMIICEKDNFVSFKNHYQSYCSIALFPKLT